MKIINIEKTEKIPVLILKGTTLLPGISMPVLVARSRGINAIEYAYKANKLIFVVAEKYDQGDLVDFGNLYSVGTICSINKVEEKEGGEKIVSLIAQHRMRVMEYRQEEANAFLTAILENEPDLVDVDSSTEQVLLTSLKETSRDILELVQASTEFKKLVDSINNIANFTNVATAQLPVSLVKKQEILETCSLKNRALKVLELLLEQRELLKLNSEMGALISTKTSKSYRQSILKEQLKLIREELNENGGDEDDEVLINRINNTNFPDDVRKIALKQFGKLKSVGNQNAESNIIRNYLELLLDLPWQKENNLDFDIFEAEKILNRDHFGLDKVKEHILRYLSVLKLNKNKKGTILLLVGPPGVGKTSLGQSIAEAMHRKYTRLSLGGVRDESEIRGHRRTYVGAMPGKIIDAIKRVNVSNPIFILDEIDKMGRGIQGDPGAALLEVLDPEQNATFRDHYLDIPFDLSQVFFIATANSIEGISPALLDRMEIINISGYTDIEKIEIAKRYLIPKIFKDNGVENFIEKITADTLSKTIGDYTREAGVRNLARKIENIASSLAQKIVRNENVENINYEFIEYALGYKKIESDRVLSKSIPGVVTGLAWTPVGGEVLFIETAMMPGTGRVQLTGKLGEVMSESAQIAISLVRSKLSSVLVGIDFNKIDFHLHVPSGAIPKDGPSAGVTMFAALTSLLLNKEIDNQLAMTGEISLRGAILPVGGIKEKIIAAQRAGIKTVLLSQKNEKDLIDVPISIKSELKFVFISDINDLLGVLFNSHQFLLPNTNVDMMTAN